MMHIYIFCYKAMNIFLSIINKIKYIFNPTKKYRGKYNIDAVYAFSAGGIRYFTVKDPHNLPYKRMVLASKVLNEMHLTLNRNIRDEYIDGMEAILSKQKISYTDIYTLFSILKKDAEIGADLDTYYQLASIYFFDESENPYKYNPVENKNKIKIWKKYNVNTFFLTMRIGHLLDLSPIQVKALQKSSETREKLLKELKEEVQIIKSLGKHQSKTSILAWLKGSIDSLTKRKGKLIFLI